MDKHRKGYCLKNTQHSTARAVCNFQQWREARIIQKPTEICPANVHLNDEPTVLDWWLCRYLTERRKTDSPYYPPKTMYHLLVGLQWYINSEKTSAQIKLQHNIEFHGLQNLCNSPFKDFYSKGVGAAVENTTSNFTWWTATVGQWYSTNRHSSRPSQLCFLLQQQKNFCFRGG